MNRMIPPRKDTVLIPKWGNVRMLVPVMDFTGMTMFHCHILEHEDIGMMGMWHIMGDGMPMQEKWYVSLFLTFPSPPPSPQRGEGKGEGA